MKIDTVIQVLFVNKLDHLKTKLFSKRPKFYIFFFIGDCFSFIKHQLFYIDTTEINYDILLTIN
jgi:hypothetical protein